MYEKIKENIYKKLSEDVTNRLYTDIELILVGPDNTITISSHRIVLISASDYFVKLFAFEGKHRESVTIK